MRGKVGTCRPEGCLLAGCFYRKHTDPGLLTQNIYDMILSVPPSGNYHLHCRPFPDQLPIENIAGMPGNPDIQESDAGREILISARKSWNQSSEAYIEAISFGTNL